MGRASRFSPEAARARDPDGRGAPGGPRVGTDGAAVGRAANDDRTGLEGLLGSGRRLSGRVPKRPCFA